MTQELERFYSLIERLKNNDQTAAQELVTTYGKHIIRAIHRQHRRRRYHVIFSTEDCEQSVWASVFGNLERLAQLETPEALIAYLAAVAQHKLVDQHRRGQRKKLGFENEVLMRDSQIAERFAYSDPTPSQAVEMAEEVALKTRSLSDTKRTILDLYVNGQNSDEIRDAIHGSMTARNIRRVIQVILQRLRLTQ